MRKEGILEGTIEIKAMGGGHIEVYTDLKHVSRNDKAAILSSIMASLDIDPENIVDVAELLSRIVVLRRTAKISRCEVNEELLRRIDQKGEQT